MANYEDFYEPGSTNKLLFLSGRGSKMLLAAQSQPKKKTPAGTQKAASHAKLNPAEVNSSHQKKRERPLDFEEIDDIVFGNQAPPPAQRPRTVHTPLTISDAAAKRNTQTPAPPARVAPNVGNINRYFTAYNQSRSRRSTMVGVPYRSYAAQQRASAPAGLINLGNTCYLNAVLQSLFSLPTFPGAIKAAAASCGNALPSDGVLHALNNCLVQRDASSAAGFSAFSPEQVKLAVGLRLGAFRGSFQQDAHEFFCGLLEAAQGEVLAVESSRLGRKQLHVSETADPSTRVFGFAVEHEITCNGCDKVTKVTEQCTHLSLDLPKKAGKETVVPLGLDAMLSSYFAEEELEKGCEGCEAECIGHTVRRKINRLPQILALHVKRFQVSMTPGGDVTCAKVRQPISIQTALRLRKFCVEKPSPPLPQLQPPAASESGKENQQINKLGAAGATGRDLAQIAAVPLPALQHHNNAPTEPAIRSRKFYSSGPMSSFIESNEPVRTFSRKPKATGAATSSYWDDPIPPGGSGKSLWTDKAAGIIGANSSHHRGTKALGDEEEDADLAAAIEASKREAERVPVVNEHDDFEDAELATAIKRSLEEQQQQQQQEWAEQCGDLTETNIKPSGAGAEIDLGEAITPGKGRASTDSPADGRDPGVGQVDEQERTAAVPFSPLPEIVEDDVEIEEKTNQKGHDDGAEKEHIKGNPTGLGGTLPLLATITPPGVGGKFIPLAQYRLTAVISHHGPSAESGHFTADTRHATNGEWYRFNDAQVHRIAGDAATNEMRERDCYMLFYTAV